MVITEKGEKDADRQCWDCIKRRLVCDRALPHCRKCQKAGRQCSGYDDTKPLQWVETGMVSSRKRKKKDSGPPKAYIVTPTRSQRRQPSLQRSLGCEKEIYECLYEDDYIRGPVDFKDTLASYMLNQRSQAQYGLPELHVTSLKQSTDAREAGRVLKTWGRAKVEEVVKNESHEEAVTILGSRRDPLNRLKRFVDMLEKYDVPSYAYLSNETSEVVQAVHYCKCRHVTYRESPRDSQVQLMSESIQTGRPRGSWHQIPPLWSFLHKCCIFSRLRSTTRWCAFPLAISSIASHWAQTARSHPSIGRRFISTEVKRCVR